LQLSRNLELADRIELSGGDLAAAVRLDSVKRHTIVSVVETIVRKELTKYQKGIRNCKRNSVALVKHNA